MNWFVALPIDPGDWFDRLVARAPTTALRLFHRDDLHITVAFLGRVEPERASAAWEATAPLARGRFEAPLAARLGRIRPMGAPRRFSALSVVLEEGGGPIAGLMAELRAVAWRAAGAEPDHRPALPHLTVARPTRSAREPARRAALAWAAACGEVGARVTVAELALYTWAERTGRDELAGRRFQIVERASLVR